MATREANTQGGTLESGCTYKKPATSPNTHKHGNETRQTPQSNPTQSAPDGHKIK